MIALLALCAPSLNATQLEYLTKASAPRCVKHSKAVNAVLGSFNIASDVYILVLPLPAVW